MQLSLFYDYESIYKSSSFFQKYETLYIDVTNDARSQVPRESYAYKHAFKQRTEVERYFSRLGDREAEQTSHFNYLSIRNQMSIAHLTLSLTALAAVILKRSDKIRCFRSFADAA